MNVAIIGNGNMGSSLTMQLVHAGYDVALVGRNVEKPRHFASSLGPHVTTVYRRGAGRREAEPDRYHLVLSFACLWASRTLSARELKRFTDLISVTFAQAE